MIIVAIILIIAIAIIGLISYLIIAGKVFFAILVLIIAVIFSVIAFKFWWFISG